MKPSSAKQQTSELAMQKVIWNWVVDPPSSESVFVAARVLEVEVEDVDEEEEEKDVVALASSAEFLVFIFVFLEQRTTSLFFRFPKQSCSLSHRSFSPIVIVKHF